MAQDKNINDSGISTLVFDLDHTLWDFELNSSLALEETLENLSLVGRNGLTAENFIKRYHVINDRMWDQYRRGKIEKSALRSVEQRDDRRRPGKRRTCGIGRRFRTSRVVQSFGESGRCLRQPHIGRQITGGTGRHFLNPLPISLSVFYNINNSM